MAEGQQPDLTPMRHSLAHIMANAVQHLWPEAKFGVGPVVENGFYYDIDLGPKTKITEEDLAKIEAEMHKIIEANQPFERFTKPIDEAINWAKEAKQPYKEELLNDLKRAGTTAAKDLNKDELGTITEGEAQVTEVSFYKNGDFTDLCRGPHVENTGQAGPFKLLRVSGAYWRGKDTNPQMQRLYGVAFADQAALDAHLTMLEEAKKRDHRKIGQEMDLFVFSDLVGAGLPLWTPRGTVMRQQIDNFVQELRDEYDFMPVTIPHITKKDLYEKSGHWGKFADELFRIKTREGHEFAMKPMNCPHHTQIYASRARSYRELPIRYRETTMVYRDEQTGELGGLSRVRAITQDDAHVFCRQTQIKDEAIKLWDIIERFYGTLEMPLRLRLSLRDPDNPDAYLGKPESWDSAENQLRELAKEKAKDGYEEGVGEAAFYGPKLDFMARDAIGREHQVATIQLDFNQPEGFDLTCINEKGEQERIVMVHCAVAGSLERCLSVLIEHYAGRFPIWLAPVQVRVATVNQDDTVLTFANEIMAAAKKLGVRAELDDTSESVGKKIRDAEVSRVPYTLVIGEKEVKGHSLQPRIRKDIEVIAAHPELSYDAFLKTVANESKMRVTKSSI